MIVSDDTLRSLIADRSIIADLLEPYHIQPVLDSTSASDGIS